MAVAITKTRTPTSANGVASSGGVSSYSDGGSLSIGTASSDRIVVVCVCSEVALASINSCTIDSGGGAVSMRNGSQGNIGAVFAKTFYLPVATGTTATIAVTYGAAVGTTTNNIAVYSVTGASPTLYARGSEADTDADPISSAGALAPDGSAPTIPTNGGCIAVCCDATNTVSRTWTGITVDINVDCGAFRFSTGTSTTGGTPTITVSGANNEDGVLSWLTFLPASTGAFGDLKGISSTPSGDVSDPHTPDFPLVVAIGDLIFVAFGEQSASVTAVGCTDNLGNNYTTLNGAASTDHSTKAFFSVCTVAGDCTPAIDTTASANGCGIICAAFEGPWAASPLDINTTAVNDAAEPYSANATGTLAQSDELIVGYFDSQDIATLFDTPAPSARLHGQIGGGLSLGQFSNSSCLTSLVVSSTASIAMAISDELNTRSTMCCSASFKKATAGAQQGSGTFAGAGVLSNFANLNAIITAQYVGSGTLQAFVNLSGAVTARFSGTGNLSANISDFKFGAATFAGVGNLSAESVKYKIGETTFAGIGNMSVYTRQNNQATATFGGIGNISASVVQGLRAAATFNGLGNLSVDATVTSATGQQQFGAATFAGVGNLSALAAANQVAAATFAGIGNLSVYITQVKVAAATFDGIGNLSADTRRISPMSATFAGSGNLNAAITQQNVAAAIFGGIGNLSAFATVTGAVNQWSGEARFAGAGALSALAIQNQQASASFIGAGNLSARVQIGQSASAVFSGIGSLSATTLATTRQAAATFSGVGNLSAFATITGAVNVWQGSATFAGIGNLSAYASSVLISAIRFNATGSLLADSIKYKLASVTFGGIGNLSATSSIVKYGEIRLEGSSSLYVSTISRQMAIAIFGGEGFLRAQVTGGRTRRVPTNSSIAKLINDMRPDQTQDTRHDQTQTNRRLKVTHG